MRITLRFVFAIFTPVLFMLWANTFVLNAHAEALDNWHWRNPVPTPNRLSAVAYGHGLFVAVGDLGVIQTSADGITWTVRHSDVSPLTAVTYGNGLFVAVGGYRSILTSPDGINWSEGAFAGLFLNGVAYGSGLFVAISDNGVPLLSTNGLDWAQGPIVAPYGRAITYGNGRFVAVMNGEIYTATNAVNWTLAYTAAFPLAAVVYGANTFVVVGGSGGLVVSGNGTNWVTRFSGAADLLSAVTYGNGVFVAVTYYGAILTSVNTINWTQVGVPANNGFLNGLAFGNGLFVAVGERGVVFTASNPTLLNDWTNRTSLTTQSLPGVAYGNGTFVAVGQGGAILRSSGGSNWVTESVGAAGPLAGITYGAGKFVAVGASGTILTSLDGISWASNSVDLNLNLNNIVYGGGRFVAAGSELDPSTAIFSPVVLTSSDALAWSKHELNVSSGLTAIAYGNGKFVGVMGGSSFTTGDASTVLVSSDGAAWTCHSLGQNISLNCITFGDNAFVALGSLDTFGAVAASPDGINWFVQQSATLGGCSAVTYRDGVFVAVASGIATSVDVFDWTNRFSGPTLFGVTGGNGTFVAVGDQGTILQSDVVSNTGSGPPLIIEQPRSLVAFVGATAGFSVGVSGVSPIQYQWQKNGLTLPGYTNSLLLLTNLESSNAGVYRVIVSNLSGGATSQVAGLVVGRVSPFSSWQFRDAGISLLPDPTLNAVTYGNSIFVAMGNSGLLLTSSNGVNWSRHPLSLGLTGNALAFGNGTFVALGNVDFGCADVLFSHDGITWIDPLSSNSRPGCLGAAQALTFGGGKFVAVGSELIAVSTNGTLWTASVYGADLGLKSIAYGNGLFVAVGTSSSGAGNVILTSTDGLGWTYATYDQDPMFPLSGDLRHVAYGNGRFVVTGLNGYTLVSEDGVNWESHALPAFFTLDVIAFNAGFFVATPDSAFGPPFPFLTSTDGVVWVSYQVNLANFFSGTVRDIAFGQDAFVAVGSGGLILQSDPLLSTAPGIARQPRNRSVPVGGSVTLSLLATGSSPMNYDWYKDGTILCASNGPSLTIENAQLANAGIYQAIVRNPYGSIASLPITLIVEPVQPILSLRFAPSAQLTILGCLGCNYLIESQDDFSPDSSTPWRLRAFLPLPANPYTWTDPESSFVSRRFYRVVRSDFP